MYWIWAARPPEVNSFLLSFGPGPAPMLATATAYRALADGLRTCAAARQAHMGELLTTWHGPTASMAQKAFTTHTLGLLELAAVADVACAKATAQAAANATARATMPQLPAIVLNRAVTVGLIATNSMSQNTAAIAVNETIYGVMWTQAAMSMTTYFAQTIPNVMLPPPTVAPPITGGGFLSQEASRMPGSAQLGGGMADGTAPPSNPGTGPGTGATDPVASGLGPEGAPLTSPADQLAAADQSMHPRHAELPEGMPRETGFLGTSPSSATLAGLQGGMGSAVVLGMLRGGVGAVSSAAAGLRMPPNWTVGTTFGAPQANTAAPLMQNAAPRGASAPGAQQRRRYTEDQKSAVFAPSAGQEVSTLEPVPAVGVIDFADDERVAV
ncbi:PPE domain-containing protein [Nocardia sp. NPDC051832]|uniref:PPE family protein n=1 Tax=Nocardia sp. NPDC051832 TaxID=3155673 RepID=UPI00342C944A